MGRGNYPPQGFVPVAVTATEIVAAGGEITANKNQPNGYAGLNSSSQLTASLASKSQVPTLDKSQISTTGTWVLADLPTGTGFLKSSGGTNSYVALGTGDLPTGIPLANLASGTGFIKATGGIPSYVALGSSDVTGALGYTPENPANKGAASGYPPLDATSFIPPAYNSLFAALVSNGAVTYSSNTDLGTSNAQKYTSLTVNSGVTLQGNLGMVIVVTGTLSLSGTISNDGKGGATGTAAQSSNTACNGVYGANAAILFNLQTVTTKQGYNQCGSTGGQPPPASTWGAGGGGFYGKGGYGSGGSSTTGFNGGFAAPLKIPIAPLALWGVAGSGGGGPYTGTVGSVLGVGGGSLFVYANAITGTGTITASGTNSTDGGTTGVSVPGAPSGGFACVVVATTCSGISINAKGGNAVASANSFCGGGGSGGYVYHLYGTSTSAVLSVVGGTSTGGAGQGISGDAGYTVSQQI